MKIRNGILWLGLCTALVCSAVNPCEAGERPEQKLMKYFEKQYTAPFQVLGRVIEQSRNRLRFTKESVPLKEGQWLQVTEHRKGISPSLQRQVAWIQVEALFADSVLARIEQSAEAAVEVGDWVLSSPTPTIHLYTNLEKKHGAPPYRTLLKELPAKGMQVIEVAGDSITADLRPWDLVLRLEAEPGHLVYQLTTADNARVLFSETETYQDPIRTIFPVGHSISASSSVSGTAGELRPPQEPENAALTTPLPSGMSFHTTPASEKSEFYRLQEPFYRVVQCDLEGDGTWELALLGQRALVIYQVQEGRLHEKERYPFEKAGIWPLHLHAADLNADGGHEILVTLAEPVRNLDKQDNRLRSIVLTSEDGRLKPLVRDWPYYLRVIEDRQGERVALAQCGGDYEQYAGPIHQLRWNEDLGKLEMGEPYEPARGVYSIYQFNLVPDDPERLIVLEAGNDLHGYLAAEEKVEASGMRNYGRFREIAYPLKLREDLYLGGFDKKTYQEVYPPRRFELKTQLDGQSFLIYKERGGDILETSLRKVLGSTQGSDQVVGVKWLGQRIVESRQSKMLANDLLDFAFLNVPQGLMVLYRDADGYVLEVF